MGLFVNLQRSFANALLPSQFVAWIDAVSGYLDAFIPVFPPNFPPAGEVPTSTGTGWELVGLFQGADLTNADVTIDVSQGNVRVLRPSTLTANHTVTLDPMHAVTNEVIGIVREDTTNHTYAVINGGPAVGTMYTFPASNARVAYFQFDGVDWFALSNSGITASI